jgi:hypothetical protein
MRADTNGKSSSALLLLASAATAALGIALARGWEPGIGGEWVWRRNDLPAHLWWPLTIGLALAALSALLCRRGLWESMTCARRIISLAALVLIVFALQIALLNAVGIPWVAPGVYIISPNTTTYFSVSLGVQSPGDWIARYPDLLPTLPYHAATHPPGLVLFFWLVRKVAAIMPLHGPSPILDVLVALGDKLGMPLTPADALAAIVSAVLIALIGALGLIPLYLLTRSLTSDHTAICATCLAGSMPGLLLLGASPDLIVMTLAIAALCRGYSGYRGSAVSGLLAGVVVAAGLFLSLAFALVVVWASLWLAVGIARSPDRPGAVRRALRVALLSVVSFGVVYLALYFIWGYRPIATALQALSAHRGVTTVEAARTYWKWVLMNPVECAIFAGIPLVAAAFWSLTHLRRPQNARLASFLMSWLVLCALINLSGAVRGEVGRIWLFLLWPPAVAAGAFVAGRRDAGRTAGLLVLLQVAQAILMKGYLTIYSIL